MASRVERPLYRLTRSSFIIETSSAAAGQSSLESTTGATSIRAVSERVEHILLLLTIVAAWVVLELRGIFSPGLLDDVDALYTECAREMLVRHDYVTPFIDGIRFFDKPPLMYWMAAGSMRLFGVNDWAARLPLALLTLALLLAVCALGTRLFNRRGGLYAGVVTATCIGPYLFTRFVIPDILLALWMTLGAHLLVKAVRLLELPMVPEWQLRWVCWGFAAVAALNVLTKGLIGLVFPLGLVVLYLLATRQLPLLRRMYMGTSTLVFLLLAAPWHVLAAVRNPAVAGSAVARGWLWFFFVNEQFLRFLGKRIPHDYGQLPIPLFLGLGILWLAPWTGFLPAAVVGAFKRLRVGASKERDSALLLLLWAGLVFGFFCFSSRQEYYSLPALPALALLAGGLLARAHEGDPAARRRVLLAGRWVVLPVSLAVAGVTGYFALTAPTPPPGMDIATLLSSNPASYTLSLGHILDLTGQAMGAFRLPLAALCVAMLAGVLPSHLLRMRGRHLAANLLLAMASIAVLLCVHEGLARFYPIIGSKSLALAINAQLRPGDQVLIDGEYTLGSSINFYTQQPVLLVNGRMNGTWYGSYWPDAPHIFRTDNELRRMWAAGTHRLFLLTYDPKRAGDLARYGAVVTIAASGGKTVLSNCAGACGMPGRE